MVRSSRITCFRAYRHVSSVLANKGTAADPKAVAAVLWFSTPCWRPPKKVGESYQHIKVMIQSNRNTRRSAICRFGQVRWRRHPFVSMAFVRRNDCHLMVKFTSQRTHKNLGEKSNTHKALLCSQHLAKRIPANDSTMKFQAALVLLVAMCQAQAVRQRSSRGNRQTLTRIHLSLIRHLVCAAF
jgi:hypothetical protein